MAHMFSELQTSCWHNKMRVKKRETLTNQGNHNLAYWPYIGTNNIWQNSKTTNITVILNWNERKNSVNDKHNPQAKLPVLNRHNQNTNITTVQMLMVLLQWLCGKVWESEFSYLWQQWTCHCACSLGYIYITATKSRDDWSLWLRISDNPLHMYHVTFILHHQTIQIPTFFP